MRCQRTCGFRRGARRGRIGAPLLSNGTLPSGLSYTFTSLSSRSDSLSCSNDGIGTFIYTPAPDATGYEGNVTHF